MGGRRAVGFRAIERALGASSVDPGGRCPAACPWGDIAESDEAGRAPCGRCGRTYSRRSGRVEHRAERSIAACWQSRPRRSVEEALTPGDNDYLGEEEDVLGGVDHVVQEDVPGEQGPQWVELLERLLFPTVVVEVAAVQP